MTGSFGGRIVGYRLPGALMMRIIAVAAIALMAVGCIDSTRVNETCTWSDGVARRLDLSTAEDREHLRADAQIANELMVRFGDAHGKHRPDIQRPFRDQCMSAMTDSIVARHGVTQAQISRAETERVWWADLLLVFLPMAIAGALAMDAVTRRVCAAFEPEDRAMAALSVVLLTLAVAGLTVAVANFWAFEVESWRLGNGHVSNRAFFIPVVRHGWIAYFTALAVCTGAAARRLRRTPLTGGRRRMLGLGR